MNQTTITKEMDCKASGDSDTRLLGGEVVMIPRCAVYDHQLPDGKFRLLALFCDHRILDHVEGLSISDMAKALNWSARRVSREIHELAERGYIIIQLGRPYQPYRYVILHFTPEKRGDAGIKQEINNTPQPLAPSRTDLAGPGAVEVVQGGGGDRRSPSSLSSRNPLNLPAESEQAEDLPSEFDRLPRNHPLRVLIKKERLRSVTLRLLVRSPSDGVSCCETYLVIIYCTSVLGMSQDDVELLGKIDRFLTAGKMHEPDVQEELRMNIEVRREEFDASGLYTVNFAELQLQILAEFLGGEKTGEHDA